MVEALITGSRAVLRGVPGSRLQPDGPSPHGSAGEHIESGRSRRIPFRAPCFRAARIGVSDSLLRRLVGMTEKEHGLPLSFLLSTCCRTSLS
ncbi:hypothetical protein Sfum_2652 [Syntrophobacter fumaroxidans MPOB]|uniref:Uncharacterized protein n=1 Tax=Syntrophobacter fumaroxidans (strain DSM 10017 / MPOB) TaxID=335543 RepID=A0LLM8_SYNFM|nr:hypothetical protein Sfum_2652 [Syntrophobacter fumaroxidans MPOB]